MDHEPKPRWHQFRLRTLFIVMTLMALACPWAAAEYHEYQYRRERERRMQAARELIEKRNLTLLPIPSP